MDIKQAEPKHHWFSIQSKCDIFITKEITLTLTQTKFKIFLDLRYEKFVSPVNLKCGFYCILQICCNFASFNNLPISLTASIDN
jgi:hypothetical protein